MAANKAVLQLNQQKLCTKSASLCCDVPEMPFSYETRYFQAVFLFAAISRT